MTKEDTEVTVWRSTNDREFLFITLADRAESSSTFRVPTCFDKSAKQAHAALSKKQKALLKAFDQQFHRQPDAQANQSRQQ